MKAALLKIFSVLACTIGLVSSARAIVITFDDLPNSTTGLPIPNGYAGLDWNDFSELNGTGFSLSSGFRTGVVSPNNVAFNTDGMDATITPAAPATTFTLSDGFFTAARDSSGLLLTVTGYGPGNSLLHTTSFTLYTTGPSYENFDWTGLSEVIFSLPGGGICSPCSPTQFVLDNLCVVIGPSPVSSVPEPTKTALSIFFLGMGIIGAFRARRQRGALLPCRA